MVLSYWYWTTTRTLFGTEDESLLKCVKFMIIVNYLLEKYLAKTSLKDSADGLPKYFIMLNEKYWIG